MKDILWVKLPAGTSEKVHRDVQKMLEKKSLSDSDIEVIITSGDMELHFFSRRVFVYPYWILKLKMLFK